MREVFYTGLKHSQLRKLCNHVAGNVDKSQKSQQI